MGTLLGQYHDGGVVDVTNSYAVVHEEPKDDRPLAFGAPSNQKMYKLHRHANPSEIMLGWYATTIDQKDIDEEVCHLHKMCIVQCASVVLQGASATPCCCIVSVRG